MILFDTNILVYSQLLKDPRSAFCRQWIKKSENHELKGIVSPQNLIEFISVMIKTNRILKKKVEINRYVKVENHLQKFLQVVFPNSQTLTIFNHLITDKVASSKKVFDIFLVATMLSNGVRQILTYNAKDFAEFKEIKVISPEKSLTRRDILKT